MRTQIPFSQNPFRLAPSSVLLAMLILGILAPMTFASSTAVPGFGVLEVRTEPPVASTITVEGEVRNTGHLRQLLLPVGEYEVSFGDVSGFLTPPAVSATIRDGDQTEIVGQFSPAGLVEVSIDPPGLEPVITVDGEVRDRGATTVPVAPGSTEICADAVQGHESPQCVTAQVAVNETVPVTLHFRPADGVGEGTDGTATHFAALLSHEELRIQRNRIVNGPFRLAGDFAPHSPGHWTEMEAAMRLNFASARWNGPSDLVGGRVTDSRDAGRPIHLNVPPGNTRQMAHDMMSAAYAAAITDNHDVAAAILAEIEWYAARPTLQFWNETQWPLDNRTDTGVPFGLAVWAKDLLVAYDVCKAMGHSSAAAETWFAGLARINERAVRDNMTAVFPNRSTNNYSARAALVNNTVHYATRQADGSPIPYPVIALYFNNRRSNQAGYVGLAGVILGEDAFPSGQYFTRQFAREEFKRYMREWVMFGHRATDSDGLFGDVNRGRNDLPQLGWSYAVHALEAIIPAMDGLARQGDIDLYQFASSEGAATPQGATNHYKSMEDVLDTYIRWIRGTYPAQYTGTGIPNSMYDLPPASVAGNPAYRVQSRMATNGREIVNDAMLLMPANYYGRQDWHDAIMRIGTPSRFSQHVQNVGPIGGWRADWRHRFLRSMNADHYPSRGELVP